MGAVFGFFGPRAPSSLERMREALSHRERGQRLSSEHDQASVGTLGRHPFAIASDEQALLAVVGEVFDLDGDRRANELLRRYRDGGIRALEASVGACSMVLVEFATPAVPARLSLLRDGSGARPLYWGAHQGRVYFAVEPKAILAVQSFPRRLRLDAVAQYLSYSFQPGSGTMLQDVHEVGLGERVTFKGDPREKIVPVTTRFFLFEDGDTSSGPAKDTNDDTWVRQTRNTVRAAIRDRLPPASKDVTVFLSGGLDSSLVTAEIQRQRREQGASAAHSYAIHFGEKYANELPFARAVAEQSGTVHEDVCISPKAFLPRLRSIVHQLDDPIGDPITVPNFELARRVAPHADAVFNGEGGDPLFGGPKNLSMMLHNWYGLDDKPFAQERAYLRAYRRAYEERNLLMTPEAWNQVDEHGALEAPLHAFFSAKRPASALNKLMAINIRLKGASLILPKVDRMLGAHGVAVRSPLFDARLTTLSFAMPPQMKLRHGIEKWALKRAFEDLLPPSVVERPKSGMRVPVHFWFQGELKRYAKKILSPRELARVGLFDPGRVKKLLDYDIDEGRGRYGIKLWMLLTFELWRRIVIDKERP